MEDDTGTASALVLATTAAVVEDDAGVEYDAAESVELPTAVLEAEAGAEDDAAESVEFPTAVVEGEAGVVEESGATPE